MWWEKMSRNGRGWDFTALLAMTHGTLEGLFRFCTSKGSHQGSETVWRFPSRSVFMIST